jgi:phenylacetate-coenzyme A ligase PaaK-like adenylate-forming protein
MIAVTPLEKWIGEKAGIASGLAGRSFVEALADYQLRQINETIDYARRNTPFYRRSLASLPDAPLAALSDIGRIPFTAPSELAAGPFGFLAVPQDEIAHIVTLRTSGSTGEAKRLFFTGGDLELTVDFFHHGMSTLVRPGQRVAVLLPCERPDSVGDLLIRGLRRMDVDALAYGPVADPIDAARAIASFGANCLVGIPTQVLAVALSQAGAALAKSGTGGVESVLLSTDYVPRAIAGRLEERWGCRVFTHYGMTEMGLGGGVECEALDGYHLREADLFFEIVDHGTGEACPDGTAGEVVFTTLTRKGMPLIRYRTGDIARMLPDPCPCGSALRRMGRASGRWDGAVRLGPGCVLTLPDMDETLFGLPGVLDYRAAVLRREGGRSGLHVDVHRAEGAQHPTEQEVLDALGAVDGVRKGIAAACLEAPVVRFSPGGAWATTGVAKRKIVVSDDAAA